MDEALTTKDISCPEVLTEKRFHCIPCNLNFFFDDYIQHKAKHDNDQERYCNRCGHFQLDGDVCSKCGVSGMWVDHDF